VPLSTVARIERRTSPLVINHLGQFPSTTISFNLAPNASLGAAVDAIRQAERQIGLPASIRTSFQGAALAFQSSLDNTLLLILAAVITMYIVLGVLYESYIHPLTILSTLPSAAVGALLALLLTGTDLGIIAVIGTGLYLVGRFTNHPGTADLGWRGTAAVLFGGGTARGLKGLTGRATPFATAGAT